MQLARFYTAALAVLSFAPSNVFALPATTQPNNILAGLPTQPANPAPKIQYDLCKVLLWKDKEEQFGNKGSSSGFGSPGNTVRVWMHPGLAAVFQLSEEGCEGKFIGGELDQGKTRTPLSKGDPRLMEALKDYKGAVFPEPHGDATMIKW